MPLFQLRVCIWHLSFSRGTFFSPIHPRELQSMIQGSPTLATTSKYFWATFKKYRFQGLSLGLWTLNVQGQGLGISILKISTDDLDTLLDWGGGAIRWAILLTIVKSPRSAFEFNGIILLFPCRHLYHSSDVRAFSYFLDQPSTCSHLLLSYHLLPSSNSIDIQSIKPLSWRSHSLSTHSILTFILIWFQPPHNCQDHTLSRFPRSSLSPASPGFPICPSHRPSTLVLYSSQNQFPLPLLPEHTALSKLFK